MTCTKRISLAKPSEWPNSRYSCSEPKQEAECSWCVFMKGGTCYQSFSQWKECVKDVRFRNIHLLQNKEDSSFVEACEAYTIAMTDCVVEHPEYYGVMNEINGEGDENEGNGANEENETTNDEETVAEEKSEEQIE